MVEVFCSKVTLSLWVSARWKYPPDVSAWQEALRMRPTPVRRLTTGPGRVSPGTPAPYSKFAIFTQSAKSIMTHMQQDKSV